MCKKLYAALVVMLAFSQIINAQKKLTNLTVGEKDHSSFPSHFIPLNDRFLFTATTPDRGRELWVSDGTTGGTKLLKDIFPGDMNGVSPVLEKTAVFLEGKMFFIATDGQNGYQIWSTDGNHEGTIRITDVEGIDDRTELTLVGKDIFFLIQKDTLLQVWKSDGTRNGTEMIKGGISIWNSVSFQGAANNLFFFTLKPYGSNYSRIWRSDGSNLGTFPITRETGKFDYGPAGFDQYITFKDELYFVVNDLEVFHPSTTGLMKTDGSLENTLPVKALDEIGEIDLGDVIEINERLYFSFFKHRDNRLIILESDGTEQGSKKIFDYTSSSHFIPSFLQGDGNHLIFTSANDANNTSLFKLGLDNYDLQEIKELSISQDIQWSYDETCAIEKVNDSNFFIAFPTGKFYQSNTWVTDLTNAGTVHIAEMANVRTVFPFQQRIFFSANSSQGEELWSVGQLFNDAAMFLNINQTKEGIELRNIITASDKIFFGASDATRSEEIWSYDRSTQSLSLTYDLEKGEGFTYPFLVIEHDGHILFTAYTKKTGSELWRSDGSSTGTVMVEDLQPGEFSSAPMFFTKHKGVLFFTAWIQRRYYLCKYTGGKIEKILDFGENQYSTALRASQVISAKDHIYLSITADGEDLWRSDGTKEGTFKVKDFAIMGELTHVNGKLFFAAQETLDSENELWISDGSGQGTTLVKNIGEGYSSYPRHFINFNDQLVFSAYSEEIGREFWMSDGTTVGTGLIRDINPGNNSSITQTEYSTADGYLYFAANDGVNGSELWKTDGTSEGTRIVKDINPGVESSFPGNLTSHNNKIYFRAFTAKNGVELWVTGGEVHNTRELFDLAQGARGSMPTQPLFIDDELFFTAVGDDHSRQLWSFNTNEVTSLNDNELVHFQLYPNPTTKYIYITRWDNVRIFDAYGQKVATYDDSTEKIYVGHLLPGLYVITGESREGKISRKFIKR